MGTCHPECKNVAGCVHHNDDTPKLELPLQDSDPVAPCVSDATLAVMEAGMDPDAHMNYIEPTPEHEFLNEEDIARLQVFAASLRKLTTLEDQREQTLLQVMLSAKAVCDDAGQFMHQEATHYLVDKEYIDRLREALLAYTNANETYIGTVDGIDATPSTPEM